MKIIFKLWLLILMPCILIFPSSKDLITSRTEEFPLLQLQADVYGGYCLKINGESIIKIRLKDKIERPEFSKTWNTLINREKKVIDPTTEYHEIIFKPVNSWKLSNYRITLSCDEESFEKGVYLITLKGLQSQHILFKREGSYFKVLTNHDCELLVRLLIKSKEKQVEWYYLKIFYGLNESGERIILTFITSPCFIIGGPLDG